MKRRAWTGADHSVNMLSTRAFYFGLCQNDEGPSSCKLNGPSSAPAFYENVMADEFYTKTLQVKIKSGMAWLNAAAIEANQVWNYAAAVSEKALKPYVGKPKALSGFDLNNLVSGATHEFEHIGSGTLQEICEQYAVKRRKSKRARLRWRVSFGAKRSLGWVAFKRGNVRFKDGAIVFAGQRFRVFDSYGLDQYDLRAGSFAQNALGEWFLNVAVQVATNTTELPAAAVGIDLGLKTTATCSDGVTLEAGQFYRGIEQQIAQAQRRGHKRQAKRLHRKAANRRKDALHKFSSTLVQQNGAIYIGDVSSVKLTKTRMAKSVLDSGWGMLKTMIVSKGHRAGRIVEIVSERNTTRACSACGALTGPSGVSMLGVRGWTCSGCLAEHQRDINASRNILAAGLGRPMSGTLSACGGPAGRRAAA